MGHPRGRGRYLVHRDVQQSCCSPASPKLLRPRRLTRALANVASFSPVPRNVMLNDLPLRPSPACASLPHLRPQALLERYDERPAPASALHCHAPSDGRARLQRSPVLLRSATLIADGRLNVPAPSIAQIFDLGAPIVQRAPHAVAHRGSIISPPYVHQRRPGRAHRSRRGTPSVRGSTHGLPFTRRSRFTHRARVG